MNIRTQLVAFRSLLIDANYHVMNIAAAGGGVQVYVN